MTDEARSIYPDLFRFLEAQGLSKTLRAFKKETQFDENTVVDGGGCRVDVVKAILDARRAQRTDTADKTLDKAERKRFKLKRKREQSDVLVEATPENAVTKKKETDSTADALREEVANMVSAFKSQQVQQEDETTLTPPHKKRKQSRHSEGGTSFVNGTSATRQYAKRLDEQKWLSTVKDPRLLDQSFQTKGGDAFAYKAAEELGRVRGKDFRKEMQKKKRASWKGCGQIDDKINSIKFDSD